MPQSFIANGNISPARFVTQGSTLRTVTTSATTDKPIGIADKYTHNVPGTVGGVALDDGFAAIAGMSVNVFLQEDVGQPVWLEVGGTVAAGDFLKPNTNSDGRGITTTTDGDYYGARALQAGTIGQMIKVLVIMGFRG